MTGTTPSAVLPSDGTYDEERLAQALRLMGDGLHEIDFEDVLLSEEIRQVVGSVALRALQKVVPEAVLRSGEGGELLSVMPERAWWVDDSRALVLDAQIMGKHHFFFIPREHWRCRQGIGH